MRIVAERTYYTPALNGRSFCGNVHAEKDAGFRRRAETDIG
jgi:hypothetical protein